MAEVRRLEDQDLPERGLVVRFLKAVGSDPDALPPGLNTAAVPLVPLLRRGRPIEESELPLAELAPALFQKLVVSGGHRAGFDAICDDLAERIGAYRMVIEGACHEIQFSGPPLNEALLALWGTASSGFGTPVVLNRMNRSATARPGACQMGPRVPLAITSRGRESARPTPWPHARGRNTHARIRFCRRRHAGRAHTLDGRCALST
jgi:hypothetical protein